MKLSNKKIIYLTNFINPIWKLIYILFPVKKFKKNDQVKILIFDFHLIGDIVLLIPLLTGLRKNYPNSKITLVSGPWAFDILRGESLVDEYIYFSAPWVKKIDFISGILRSIKLLKILRRKHWDIGIEVRGDIRQILMLYLARPVIRVGFTFMGGDDLLTNIASDDGSYAHILSHHRRILQALNISIDKESFFPEIHLNPDELLFANSIEPYIGVHFGASLPLRRMPNSESIRIINKLVSTGRRVVVFVQPDNRDFMLALEKTFLFDRNNYLSIWEGGLRDMIVMLSRAEMVYAMDSGVAHISAALGTSTTVFFGPNLPELVSPVGKNVIIKDKEGLSCRPCNQITCSHPIKQFCLIDLV
jgi:ADP-heptose:LPS heptosyltransferase